MNALIASGDARDPWMKQRDALSKVFEADEVETVELAGTAWPVDVRPLVDRFVQVKLAHRQAMSDATHATTEAEFVRLADQALAQPECQEANAVRTALGLGEAGGDCPTPTPS